MKKYTYMAAALILCGPLSQGHAINHRPGLFFSAEELEKIQGDENNRQDDLIVLWDGTQVKGKIPQFPELRYQYGILPLGIQDLSALSVSSTKSGNLKLELITREGFRFVVDNPERNIPIVQSYPSKKGPYQALRQEIEPNAISYILVGERMGNLAALPHEYYTLVFNGGDELPVFLKDEAIQLSNGWKEYSLPTSRILDINFDGGIYGSAKGDNGEEVEIDFGFVKDKHLKVQIAKTTQVVGIPWDAISGIKLVKGERNKGFENQKDASVRAGSMEHIAEIEPEPLLSDAMIDEDMYNIVWIGEIRERFSEELAYLNEDQRFGQEKGKMNLEVSAGSREELLKMQDALVTQLEFEATRAHILRMALHDLAAKWEDLRGYCKDMKKSMGERPVAQKELEKLRKALNDQANLSKHLAAHLAKYSQRVSYERDRHDDTKTALQLLEEKVSNYEKEKVALEGALEQKSEQISSLQKVQGELKDKTQSLLEEQKNKNLFQDELEGLVNQLLDRLEHEKQQARKLEQELHLAAGKASTLTRECEEVRQDLEKEAECHAKQTAEQEVLYIAMLDTLDCSIHAKDLTQKEKGDLKSQVDVMAACIDREQQRYMELNEHMSDQYLRANRLQAYANGLEVDICALREEKTDLLKQKQSLEEELFHTRNEASRTKETLNKKEHEQEITEKTHTLIYSEIIQQLEELKSSYSHERSESKRLREELETTLEKYQTKATDAQRLENEVAELRKDLEAVLLNKEENEKKFALKEQSLIAEVAELKDALGKYEKINVELMLSQDRAVRSAEENALVLQEMRDHLRDYHKTQQSLAQVLQENDVLQEKLAEIQKHQGDREIMIYQIQKDREELDEQKDLIRKLTSELDSLNRTVSVNESPNESPSRSIEITAPQQNSLRRRPGYEQAKTVQPPAEELRDRTPNTPYADFGFLDVHIVAEGDNLNTISTKYYGTPSRWSDIYEANADVITDVNHINVGTALVIPE